MIVPVILSGGSGTRLWPVSRESFPKPFIRLGGGQSLLQRTLSRAQVLSDGELCIVTNEAYAFKTRDEVRELPALRRIRITQLLEPTGRNTAPAIAVAALWAMERQSDAIMLVLPADHLIPDIDAFERAARAAASVAASGEMVLFGIAPTSPETGFGYLEFGEPLGQTGAFAVRRFVEKPDLATAAAFLQDGGYAWNSGMFCFRADTVVESMTRYAPEVISGARRVWSMATRAGAASTEPGTRERQSLAEIRLPAREFAELPAISIDYALMERAERVAAVRASFGWSDIGSWKAVSEQLSPDQQGNTTVGEVMLLGTSNSHVQSEDRLVAAIGIENILVVDTPDALLVASRDASQQVREIVGRLKRESHEAAILHRTVSRPWGSYTLLHEGPRFKIKRIEVKPGESLSMQMHHHRSEHWVVVSGTAEVTCGERISLVSPNESTYIPIGARHRLRNPGKVELVMIEVQCGDYVGEDDIVRFDDVYGRVDTAASERTAPSKRNGRRSR